MLKQQDRTRFAPVAFSRSDGPMVSVIAPTYLEAGNLPALAMRIDAVLASSYRYEMIVVDDDSPDETVRICESLSAKLPLRLEVRKNTKGLSSAVLHGMCQARGDVLVVIDADLSHPPEALPMLIESLLLTDADFVVGSRYCPGGRIAEDWSGARRLLSKIATWLANPLVSVHDPMAGFFALRRSTFSKATKLNPLGFKIGLELIVRCGCKSVVEVPIEFQQRKVGTSKLTWKVHCQYLLQLVRLYAFQVTRKIGALSSKAAV